MLSSPMGWTHFVLIGLLNYSLWVISVLQAIL
nr:MAG TPA: hypothetical protein [Microviridae sp.]